VIVAADNLLPLVEKVRAQTAIEHVFVVRYAELLPEEPTVDVLPELLAMKREPRAVPPGGALKVSLFTYEKAPVESLVDACARLGKPVWIVAPEGHAARLLASRSEDDRERCGDVEMFVVPFLPQDRYDELLWACDVNFVRGEDSFVRAQWAGRPFAWHIYPQKEGAHWVKLTAFLKRYTAGLDPAAATAATALWEAWNDGGEVPDVSTDLPAAWRAFVARRESLSAHARAWSSRLQMQPDLAEALVNHASDLLK